MIGTVISYDPHTGHNQVRTSYGFVLTDVAGRLARCLRPASWDHA